MIILMTLLIAGVSMAFAVQVIPWNAEWRHWTAWINVYPRLSDARSVGFSGRVMGEADSRLAHYALVAIAGYAAALVISAGCSSSVLAPHSA